MTRKELVRGIVDLLHKNNVRKKVRAQKHIFTISDDRGQKKNFVVQESEKSVGYNAEDIESFVDALLENIWDSIKRGESVRLQGLGTIYLQYKEPYSNTHPKTGERVMFGGEYRLKFSPSRQLRISEKVYNLSVKEGKAAQSFIPELDIEEDDDDAD